MFVFVKNVTFFGMLLHGTVKCVVSKLSSQHRAYEPFFSYFRVQIGLPFSEIQEDSESAVWMQSLTSVIRQHYGRAILNFSQYHRCTGLFK